MCGRCSLEELELHTEHLFLRPFLFKDIDDVFKQGRHPQWTSYDHSVDYLFTRSDAEDFISQALLYDRSTHPHIAIVKDNQVIGGIRLWSEPPHDTAEFGCFLGTTHWGMGIASEAGIAVISWAFRSLGLAKIYAVSDKANAGRIQVLESLGMELEGVLRSHRVFREKRVDELRYGLLKSDWEAKGP